MIPSGKSRKKQLENPEKNSPGNDPTPNSPLDPLLPVLPSRNAGWEEQSRISPFQLQSAAGSFPRQTRRRLGCSRIPSGELGSMFQPGKKKKKNHLKRSWSFQRLRVTPGVMALRF